MEEARTADSVDRLLKHALAAAREEFAASDWQAGIFGAMIIALRKQQSLELKEAAAVVADFCQREAPDVFIPDFMPDNPLLELVSYDDFLRTSLASIRSESAAHSLEEQYTRLLSLMAIEVNARQGRFIGFVILDFFCERFAPELFAVSRTVQRQKEDANYVYFKDGTRRKKPGKRWWQVWPFHRSVNE